MTRKDEIKIYYLFMLIDGECSSGEIERFKHICKEHDISATEKEEIVSECEKILNRFGNRYDVIKVEISNIVGEENNSFSMLSVVFSFSRGNKKRLVWTLLNLGYADDEFSKEEKDIVDYLATVFKFDKTDYEEMTDTAETLLCLVKEKEWLKTTKRPYDEVSNKIAKIDEVIKHLYENIENLLSE